MDMTELTTTLEAPRIFPTFRFHDAERMIDWLLDAFGFTIHALHKNDDGKIGHAELAIGASIIMCGQEQDDAYGAMVGGGGRGGKSVYVAVEDVDALFRRASGAGAEILQGLTDRDYGSREFICADPEGNVWCFGTYWPKVQEG
jgi:uncharacterized glyoxalase superfamily protein PhnB